jgi:hypothetical protein
VAHRAPDAAAVHLGIGAHMRRLSVAHRVARRSAATRSQKRDCCGLALSRRRERGGHEIAIEGCRALRRRRPSSRFRPAPGPVQRGSRPTSVRRRSERRHCRPPADRPMREWPAAAGGPAQTACGVRRVLSRLSLCLADIRPGSLCARAGGVPARTVRCATCISMSRGRRPRGPHERGRQRKGHLRCSVPETRLPTR